MLKNKVALVTGSTSGIGLGIAKALAKQGAHIVLNGLGDFASAQTEIENLGQNLGVRVIYQDADLANPQAIENMMHEAHQQFGGIDILVNNAGIQHVAPVEQFPTESWDAIMAINLTAAFHTTRLALAAMRQKNWGRIINIASVHGLVASSHKSAYVAAKHGLIGLTKAVALELATTPITVNAICPGWVLTPLVQAQINARAACNHISPEVAAQQLLLEKQPSGQFTTPEQLGELAVFLCLPACNNVRGVAWAADGGWTAQ